MKYQIRSTKDFRRQYKKLERSGNRRAVEELDKVICRLECGDVLEEKYRNHKMAGNMQNCFECHVLPDWLLIYMKDEYMLILKLVGTGTHSELF